MQSVVAITSPASAGSLLSRRALIRIGLVFLLCLTSAITRADWINLSGAETAANIAEIYVLDDRVKLVLEVYVADLETFAALVPDDLLRSARERPSLRERMHAFADNTVQMVTETGEKLRARLDLAEPRVRVDRKSPFAGMINPLTRRRVPEAPADKRVLYAEISYPFEHKPTALTIVPPLDTEGRPIVTIGFIDPELRGLFASIGIEKGKKFAPDDRMKKVLEEAVAVGNATARAIWIRSRDEQAYFFEDSAWYTGFVGGHHEFLKNGGTGGRNLDARVLFHYMATVITPAMVNKMVGSGSQYALLNVDKDGEYMDGSKTYKLNIPADVPAKDFWSIVAYDPQTRSQLQTGQPFPGRNNQRHKLDFNEDGSVDLYFSPKAPEGKEANWIQTVPGKGWFIALRLYGPLEPWFDKTWQPGEIELVD